MSKQRAERFCKLCSEYNKGIPSSLQGYKTQDLEFLKLRDFSTAQAMQALEEISRRFTPNEKYDLLDACLKCNYDKPRIAGYYQETEKEKKQNQKDL